MAQQRNEQKIGASEFFSKDLYLSTPVENDQSQQFKAALREKVLGHYNNIYYDQRMEQSKSIWSKWQLLASAAFAVILVATIGFAYRISQIKETNKVTSPDTANVLGVDIAYAEGDLEVEQTENSWADITSDTQIAEGSSFRIAGEGRAIFNIDDGSSVRLASNSTVTFTKLDPSNIIVSNDEGEIYTRVVKAERTFSVVTPDATYKSLGTAYKTVNTKDVKGVYVFHSNVEVSEKEAKVVVKEGNKYFLKTKTETAKKALSITDKEIKSEFVQWNKEQDSKEFASELGILADKKVEPKKETTTKEETTTKTTNTAPVNTNTNGSISITSATGQTGKFKVQWSIADLDASQGFKVVYNQAGSPTYPNDNPNYYDANARSAIVSGLPAGTYYVRVCRYTGSGCDTYSNQGTVTVSAEPVYTPLGSITLNDAGAGAVTWNVAYAAKNGYKLVWSLSPSPVYPTNNPAYYESNKTTGNITWGGATPGNTYYVRICEYLANGTCGVYSNEISVTL